MRQALAKGKRRELRRAMGEGALGQIAAQDQAVAILQNAVASCQREIATLAANQATLKQTAAGDWNGLMTYITSVNTGFCDFKQRPFLSRLRWLFTGK